MHIRIFVFHFSFVYSLFFFFLLFSEKPLNSDCNNLTRYMALVEPIIQKFSNNIVHSSLINTLIKTIKLYLFKFLQDSHISFLISNPPLILSVFLSYQSPGMSGVLATGIFLSYLVPPGLHGEI